MLTSWPPLIGWVLPKIEANKPSNRERCFELNGVSYGDVENLLKGFSLLLKNANIKNISPKPEQRLNEYLFDSPKPTKEMLCFKKYCKNTILTSDIGFNKSKWNFKRKTKLFILEN